MEPADVEAEPANDGSRVLSSLQSLVILYRVSDSAEVPKRLIRTSCDAGAPSVPASHVRGLLAADGVDLARLLSLRCYDPRFDGWEEVAPEADLALSRCRAIEGVLVLEMLLRLDPAPPPELAALMAHPQASLGHPSQLGHPPHYQPLNHGSNHPLASAGYHPLARRSSNSYGSGELVTTLKAGDALYPLTLSTISHFATEES